MQLFRRPVHALGGPVGGISGDLLAEMKRNIPRAPMFSIVSSGFITSG